MPRAFIIHCWGSNPTQLWYPWLTVQLEKKGYTVIAPAMPDTQTPAVAAWVGALNKAVVGGVNPDDIFIGHSIGCQTIIRTLTSQLNVCSAVLLVAPWVELKNFVADAAAIASPWLTPPINLKFAASRVQDWVAFFSDDDPWVELEPNAVAFQSALGARVEVLKARGHLADELKDKEFPELLAVINEMGI